MRVTTLWAFAALAAASAGCDQLPFAGKDKTAPDADAGSTVEPTGSPAEEAVEAPTGFEREALVGVWSLDRTCESDFGLWLNADGFASYSEVGEGAWAIAEAGRVILTLKRYDEQGAPTGAEALYHLDVTPPVTDSLKGAIAPADGSAAPVAIDALRCAE